VKGKRVAFWQQARTKRRRAYRIGFIQHCIAASRRASKRARAMAKVKQII
jgi:enoyl-CoA hydratase/carnithine racemase